MKGNLFKGSQSLEFMFLHLLINSLAKYFPVISSEYNDHVSARVMKKAHLLTNNQM